MTRRFVSETGDIPGELAELVFQAVSNAGLDGISTQEMALALGRSRGAIVNQACYLSRSGYIHSSGPRKTPVWIIGAAPCTMGMAIEKAASAWDYARRFAV